MNTQKKVFNKLFKENKTELSTQKVELGLVDKLQSKYKSLGKADVGNYLSQINKLVSGLKSSIEKTGDLKDEVQKAVNGYGSMGDTDNKKLAERLFNDVKSDFDELVFIYQKLNSI